MIATSALSVGYEGTVIVPGIDLRVEPGRTLALVGVNGSGKSTLLKTVAGLLPPVGGQITVLGGAPGREPARVGYLSQFHPADSVLPFRAVDIVRMARFGALGLFRRHGAADEKAVQEAMARMGICDIAHEPLNALSGGQRQRVFLAQLLARRARLLLLDEPQTNLDAGGMALYRDALAEEVRGGAAAVIATHDIEDAAACDRVLLLARRVVAYGPGSEVLTPEALLETFGVAIRIGGQDMVIAERSHRHECGPGEDEE